jgi:hypothetical protein
MRSLDGSRGGFLIVTPNVFARVTMKTDDLLKWTCNRAAE